ncbi:Fc.00g034400.m01.CDS01 [Cosmosporella sp. VM-42]
MGMLTRLGLRRSSIWEPYTILDYLLSSPLVYFSIKFYYFILFLRACPVYPPKDKHALRIVCIADTHNQTVTIPDGDILIHAGDLTDGGTVAELNIQFDWLRSQPHPVKVVVAGNHDYWFDPVNRPAEDVRSGQVPDLTSLIYLENSSTVQEVKGRRLHIYGAPYMPKVGDYKFAFEYTEATQPWLRKVPMETDILVTHCPPQHHRDLYQGCPHLLREVWRVKPLLHIFGHAHWSHGTEPVFFDEFQEAYERLLSRPRRGLIRDFIPSRKWLDVLIIVYYGICGVLLSWLSTSTSGHRGSMMVNAAQVHGNTGKVRDRAIVLEI